MAGRKRSFVGRPEANKLAEFLVSISEPRSTRQLAQDIPGAGHATWAKYLNGSEIIPAPLLTSLISTLFAKDEVKRRAFLHDGKTLRAAAVEESRRPEESGSSVQLLHQQLYDALEGKIRAEDEAAKANNTVATLRQMGATLEAMINTVQTQLHLAVAGERTELELQLEQAHRRLERTETELDKAQHRRYTAEQAQQALAKEALETRQQIARLQQRVEELTVPDLPAVSPAGPTPQVLLDAIDDELDHIVEEGREADETIADLVEQAHLEPDPHHAQDPTVITGTVIPQNVQALTVQPAAPALSALSKTTLDSDLTSENEDIPLLSAGPSPMKNEGPPPVRNPAPAPAPASPPVSDADHQTASAPPYRQANAAGPQGTMSSLAADLADATNTAAVAKQLRALRVRAGAHHWPLAKLQSAAYPSGIPAREETAIHVSAWLSGRALSDKDVLRRLVVALGATELESEAFEDAWDRVAQNTPKGPSNEPSQSAPARVGSVDIPFQRPHVFREEPPRTASEGTGEGAPWVPPDRTGADTGTAPSTGTHALLRWITAAIPLNFAVILPASVFVEGLYAQPASAPWKLIIAGSVSILLTVLFFTQAIRFGWRRLAWIGTPIGLIIAIWLPTTDTSTYSAGHWLADVVGMF
ncbi:hypothetical protein ABZY57_04450 [Streptomyces sp. NPDC006450]|uniref:hypothetical protein n=1 Tax=Streptomyces sp. NPDC006450 TaxID=3155458 RepID=UPI0033B2B469